MLFSVIITKLQPKINSDYLALSGNYVKVMHLILNIIFSGVITGFSLLFHNNTLFHLMVSISNECK